MSDETMKLQFYGRQLIVLGNGFDCACALPSDFPSFFEPRREKLKSAGVSAELSSSLNALKSSEGLTVWDSVLSSRKGDNWCNVEEAIAEWAFPPMLVTSRNWFRDLHDCLALPSYRAYAQSAPRLFGGGPTESAVDNRVLAPVATYILLTEGFEAQRWSKEKLSSYMLSELGRLEAAFNLYLQRALNEKPGYNGAAWGLMSDLIRPECPAPSPADVETVVLNFNYTSPLALKPRGIPIHHVNVHGTLRSEIVFGVDSKKHMDSDLAVPFTKTYRLLGLRGGSPINLFQPFGSDARRVDASFSLIKFFGHSLAEADYSYFQSIFDEVDLYGGDARLIFYYRKHDGKDPRVEVSKAVAHLLTEYGRTMDNEDHGRNLMHKLLLEGRLSVLELGRQEPITPGA